MITNRIIALSRRLLIFRSVIWLIQRRIPTRQRLNLYIERKNLRSYPCPTWNCQRLKTKSITTLVPRCRTNPRSEWFVPNQVMRYTWPSGDPIISKYVINNTDYLWYGIIPPHLWVSNHVPSTCIIATRPHKIWETNATPPSWMTRIWWTVPRHCDNIWTIIRRCFRTCRYLPNCKIGIVDDCVGWWPWRIFSSGRVFQALDQSESRIKNKLLFANRKAW